MFAGRRNDRPGGRPKRLRGTLNIVALLFVGSALLRLLGEAGAVLAAQDGVMPVAPASDEVCHSDEATNRLVAAIQKRTAELDAREKAIAERQVFLSEADQQIEAKLAELEAAEASLRKVLSVAQDGAEQDIARLTAVYASMKPKSAAALFQEMEPNFAAGVLTRMPPESAAEILSLLDPGTAHAISVVIAGRTADVRGGTGADTGH